MNFLHRLEKRKYSYAAINCLLLVLFTPFFFSEKKTPETETHAKNRFLYMHGQVKSGRDAVARARVEVFTDSVTRFSMTSTDTAGWCTFKLPLQNRYLIKYIAYGYVTKKITVDAFVPKKRVTDYYCEFNAEMFESIPEIDVSVLKNPVAHFFFNENRKNFDYDMVKAEKINRELRTAYVKYRTHKKNESTVYEKEEPASPAPLR